MNVIQSAGFIVFKGIDKEIQFLLLHYCDGHWDFPKGKVEGGESLQQGAIRELYEETGLSIKKQFSFQTSFNYIFVDRNGIEKEKKVTLFLTDVEEVPVILSHEHTGYNWLNESSALQKLTYENAQNALRLACDYLKSLHL